MFLTASGKGYSVLAAARSLAEPMGIRAKIEAIHQKLLRPSTLSCKLQPFAKFRKRINSQFHIQRM